MTERRWAELPPAYLCYALLGVLLLAVVMPPFQNPDETNHTLRADSIGRGDLVGRRFDGGAGSGGLASAGIVSAAAPWEAVRDDPAGRATRGLLERRPGWGDAAVLAFPNTALYPPVFYLPAALAIGVGRAAGLDVVRTSILARLLTGVVAIGLTWAALAICARGGAPGAGLLLFAVGTLPMALAMDAAIGPDGPMLGAAALAAGCLASLRARGAPRGAFALLCLCLVLVVSARPPYLPLALVPLAAPVRWPVRLGGVAAIAAVTLGWTALDAVVVFGAGTVRPGTDAAAQLLGVVSDPAHALGVLGATLRAQGGNLLSQVVGQLGSLNVLLPGPVVDAGLLVLLLCALATAGRPRWPSAVVLPAVLASVAAIVLVQFLTWTKLGAGEVEGLQGRYFLPPLAVAAGVAGRPGRLGQVAETAALAFPAVAIALAVRAVVTRFYLG